jgi:hypothetical protein
MDINELNNNQMTENERLEYVYNIREINNNRLDDLLEPQRDIEDRIEFLRKKLIANILVSRDEMSDRWDLGAKLRYFEIYGDSSAKQEIENMLSDLKKYDIEAIKTEDK